MTLTVAVSDPIQVLKIILREYEVFGGLDVDHHSIAVTFTDHQKLMRSLRLPYSARQLLNYVGKHFPEQRIAFAYEAGPTGFGLCDELMATGHVCLVVAPPMVPRPPEQRVKTNRLDSRKLSTALRGGDLQSIHMPSGKYRELRHLVQLRDTRSSSWPRLSAGLKRCCSMKALRFRPPTGKRSRGPRR